MFYVKRKRQVIYGQWYYEIVYYIQMSYIKYRIGQMSYVKRKRQVIYGQWYYEIVYYIQMSYIKLSKIFFKSQVSTFFGFFKIAPYRTTISQYNFLTFNTNIPLNRANKNMNIILHEQLRQRKTLSNDKTYRASYFRTTQHSTTVSAPLIRVSIIF